MRTSPLPVALAGLKEGKHALDERLDDGPS